MKIAYHLTRRSIAKLTRRQTELATIEPLVMYAHVPELFKGYAKLEQTSPLFSELDKLAPDYAAGMTRTPARVPGELFDRLGQHLGDGQIVELMHHIALENMRARFNLALGVGSADFSNGMVCAVPVVHP